MFEKRIVQIERERGQSSDDKDSREQSTQDYGIFGGSLVGSAIGKRFTRKAKTDARLWQSSFLPTVYFSFFI